MTEQLINYGDLPAEEAARLRAQEWLSIAALHQRDYRVPFKRREREVVNNSNGFGILEPRIDRRGKRIGWIAKAPAHAQGRR